jgi:hypothetical protein
MAIDMRTDTIFIAGFHNKIAAGALLLDSGQPMAPEGIKIAESDQRVAGEFAELHLRIGIDSPKEIIKEGLTVRDLRPWPTVRRIRTIVPKEAPNAQSDHTCGQPLDRAVRTEPLGTRPD